MEAFHAPRMAKGCVANFAQEVVKGQLPLSVEGLSGQGVEQFGRSEDHHTTCRLTFTDTNRARTDSVG